MATAAPHVKLLRQLASAKDDYLSGAFDISWDGAKATLYLVFGRPSHAVFETDQEQIEGEAAIDALLAALPRVFAVSDWRRAMSPHETLSITIDELAGPFVRLAGSYADDPVAEESPEWWSAEDDSPDLPFGLADFPLLPGGRPLWIEASPEEVHLADRLAELPPSILILTGAKLRAAAVVSGGDLIDAVWIDADDHARGETAGMALLGATKGSLAGYALDDPRVAEALTMLWRLPLAVSGVELSWLDPASMLAAFRADGLDRVLVIDAPVRGIALFSRGGLVAVYSETQRSAVASPERLRSLLSQARGRLTVMERKPRPLAVDATLKPASARDHFEVAATEATAASEEVAASVAGAEPDADAEPAAGEAAPEAANADMTAEPATPEPAADGEEATPDVSEGADEPAHEAVASWGYATRDAAPAADSSPMVAAVDSAGGEHDAVSGDAPPPPPPPDEDVSAAFADTPPPPAPVPDATQPERKTKRSRWGFGRSRKSRAERHAAEAAAADIEASIESADSEAATFAGWSVRQPNGGTQPVGYRSEDAAGTPPPPDGIDAGQGDEAAPTWSLARPADDAPAAADVAAADGDAAGGESPVPDETATADTPVADEPVAHDRHTWVAADSPAASFGADGDPHTQSHPFDVVPLDEPTPEPAPQASGSWLSASWLDDVVSGEAPPAASESDATSGSDDVDDGHEQSAPDTEPVAAAGDEAAASSGEQDAGEPSGDDVVAATVDEVAASAGEQDAGEPSQAHVPVEAADDLDQSGEAPRPVPVLRTPGPWTWPLAEPDEEPRGAAAATPASFPYFPDEPEAPELQTAAVAADHEESAAAFDHDADAGFFHRDEPVGSQYVDFDEVRNELVQIGIVWLGETNAVQVTALLSNTRSTIDDFVATIDTIRGLHIEGQDPASIQAMAREMHQQAAERLCGA